LKSASLQYGNALADIALQQGAAGAVLQQLSELAAAYSDSAELRNFLSSPAVARESKQAVAEKLIARIGGSKILRNFLLVVVEHRRTQDLPEIAEAFEQVIQKRQGLAQAQVLSATPLNEPQKAQLVQALERLIGKKIQPTYSLQSDLLGGAVVRIGDTIYDGSVKNRLNQMRQHLAAE
jgi:F-type H+-transporting ATPase subunit delta